MARRRGCVLAGALGLALPLTLASSPASASTVAAPYDLDGDGRPDLVVGAPALDRGPIDEAGGDVVVPGGGGLYPDRAKAVTQSTKRVAGGSEAGDRFGSAVASADFDRDGYADLAVGIPGEDFAGRLDAGAVTVLYGTSKGVTGTRSRQFSEPSGKEQFAGFGAALAAGDVDGDGYPDLAVGAPGDDRDVEASTDNPASGTVTVLLGGPTGLTTSGSRALRGVRGSDGQQDYLFGSSLAVGDIDGTGPADVVVTAKGHIDNDDGDGYPGSVAYCSGRTGGPSTCRALVGSAQNNNAVVVGNVQGDARPEIVIGVPSSNIVTDVGHLELLTLTGTGAATRSSVTAIYHGDLGLPGADNADEEGYDSFGYALALGRVDGDRYDDLVVGAPTAMVGEERAGRVHLVHGSASGLARTGNETYDQDTAAVPGGSETGDFFGSALALVDRDGDGRLDLSVGAAGEDDGNGRVTTLPGTGDRFTGAGAQAFDLRSARVRDDRFEARFGAVAGG